MPVSIQNDARPGSGDLYVNDHWTVTITGEAPNSLVQVHAWKDGADQGVQSQGYTNGSGDFVLVGTMGLWSIGLWTEQWSVGGSVILPTLQFRVNPMAVTPSELPVEMVEGRWQFGQSNPVMPTEIFVSDDLTVSAMPCNIRRGMVRVSQWVMPFNLCSASVGQRVSTRRRMVWAY